MTVVAVGPTGTPEAREALHAGAWALGAEPGDRVPVILAAEVVLMPGWQQCRAAVADVVTAMEMGIPVRAAEGASARLAA